MHASEKNTETKVAYVVLYVVICGHEKRFARLIAVK